MIKELKPKGEPKRRNQRRIQSIEVGFRLIRELEKAGTKLSLKRLAECAQMSAAKAHLYMVSFVNLGLVVQDAATSRYGLGPYAVQLGLAAIRGMDVIELAREPMQRLQEETELSVFLSLWGNLGPMIALKLDWQTDMPVAIRVGFVLPLLDSATGHVFVASLPDLVLALVLAREASSRKNLEQRISAIRKQVRADGVGYSKSLMIDGFAAISAPVKDYAGETVAAVTVLGLRSKVDVQPDGLHTKLVKEAGEALSRSLGASAMAGEQKSI